MVEPIIPTLEPLIAGDGFLIANWTNSPYMNINNAYLLVVNRNNYSDIQYIYLTETQALEQTYKISGLLNSVEYMVQYTQTQYYPDGDQGSSNTELGIPLATPDPPIIVNTTNHPITIDYNEGTELYTVRLYVNYGSISVIPPLEKTIFKLVGQTSAVISSVLFDLPLGGVTGFVQYTFPNLTADTYHISAFNVNDHGVGPLSNVMNVFVGQSPFVADVTNVVSGQDGMLTATVDTPENNINPITSIELYYSTDNSNWSVGATIYPESFQYLSGTIIATGDITGLNNGFGYYVKAIAVNSYSSGSSGVIGTGVPAIQSVVNTVTITGASTSGTVVAGWTYAQGTFQTALTYNYVLYKNLVSFATGIVSTNSLTINNLTLDAGASLTLQVTPVDTVTDVLSFWTEPALSGTAPANQWVGSAVTSDPFIVNDSPNAPTDFRCISSANGVLTYEWTESEGSGFNDATSYTINVYIQGSTTVVQTETRDVTQPFNPVNAFSGLDNNTSYTAEIFASNVYGDSDPVTTGPNEPLADIDPVSGFVGPVQGVPLTSGFYPLLTSWDDFNQTGYTLVDYTVNVYKVVPGGDDIVVETANVTVSQYAFQSAVQGTSYYFGVITNAYENQFGSTSTVTSGEAYGATVEIGALPFINPNSVFFSLDGNNNGVITFDVDNRGSELVGLMSFVPPISGSAIPIQAPPNNYSPFQAGEGFKTYSTNLGYPIDLNETSYLIYACNSVGGSFITANLA